MPDFWSLFTASVPPPVVEEAMNDPTSSLKLLPASRMLPTGYSPRPWQPLFDLDVESQLLVLDGRGDGAPGAGARGAQKLDLLSGGL